MDDKDFVEFAIEESKMPPKFLRPYYIFEEWFHLFRNKKCAICKHFRPFMATAGFCGKSTGCLCRDMRDMFDKCDCGKFKPKMPWEKW